MSAGRCCCVPRRRHQVPARCARARERRDEEVGSQRARGLPRRRPDRRRGRRGRQPGWVDGRRSPGLRPGVGLAFLIQWLAFIPAYLLQSEGFFDLTGSFTYITVTVVAVLLGPVGRRSVDPAAGLVVIWAARLGSYLFRRIRRAGKDARFDAIKPSFIRFLNAWTLQGLWVSLTLAAALAAITTTRAQGPGRGRAHRAPDLGRRVRASRRRPTCRRAASARTRRTGAGSSTAVCGRGRATPTTSARSSLWIGVALIALPVLQGWQ